MSIRVKCEQCGAVLKVKNQLAGTIGKCPECRAKLIVPMASEEDDGMESVAETQPVARIPSRQLKNGSSLSAASVDVPPLPPAPPVVKPRPAAPAETPPVPPPPKSTALPPVPPPASAPQNDPAPPADPVPAPAEVRNDFDVDAFLADESVPNAKKSAGLAAAAEAAKANTPQDKFGRRSITATGGIGAKAGDSAAASAAQQELTGAAAAGAAKPAVDDGTSVVVVSTVQPQERVRLKLTPRQKKQAAAILAGTLLLAGVGYFVSSMILAPQLDLPELAAVEGRVTIKDAKGNKVGLANAVVSLIPVQSEGVSARKKKIGLRTSTGVTDSSGAFKIFYVESSPGVGIPGAPVNTKVRLAVTPLNPRDIGAVPERFQRPEMSNEIREIRPVGNTGKFDLEL